jgi:hypothetical protein
MIYHVTSDLDPAVLLAIATRKSEALNGHPVFAWSDTIRWRAVEVQQFDARTEQRIEFTSVRGARYVFIPLTLDRYVTHVQAKVEGHPRFASTDALQAFYEGRGPRPFGSEYLPRTPR